MNWRLLLLTPLAGLVAATVAFSATLDGKTFAGVMYEGSKEIDKNESFVFKDGKFRSTGCDKYGFKEAPYKTTVESDTTKFEAQASNGKGETMSWKGWVKGSAAEATGVWAKDGKTSGTYTFKGKAKS